jgi:glycosyltransferase involved in cell wall biosynthesis
MKIAILGTRGIPNNYGGFEQFAEYLSVGLVKRGFEVTVYNPHFHPLDKNNFKGVNVIKIYSPEAFLGGGPANFIYDFLCLNDADSKGFDIIYELGYGTVAISYFLLSFRKRKTVLITNMDGLEWKRQKWNGLTKWLTKKFEKIAINLSDYIISDNVGIQNYYRNVHKKESIFLPYGAELTIRLDENLLQQYKLQPKKYFLVIARLEPENNIELMINGYLKSGAAETLVIIGNTKNNYGEYLNRKYVNPNVHFLGGIYDKLTIDSLRHFSKVYLHGHSVGGTNPSLLEAMSCGCFIMAHDNEFNRSVLDSNAYFFSNQFELCKILTEIESILPCSYEMVKNNLDKIKTVYDWDKIISDHEVFFRDCIEMRYHES